MKVRAIIPFTMRDSSTGELTSVADGSILTVTDEAGAQLISDGLCDEYTLITPTGTKSITANGETDVTQYAKANVAVPLPSGSETITQNGTYDITDKASVVINVSVATLTYDVNGGTGTVSPVVVAAGTEVTLDTGAGLTPPDTKVFGGWGTSASATEAVESPYKVTANVTLYAIWNDAA